MKKIPSILLIITFVCILALWYTIASTWKAIKPAWFSSTVSTEEILSLHESEEGQLFSTLPDFSLQIIDVDLDSPRVIIEDPLGNLLISEPSASRVSVVSNGKRTTLIDDLNRPHGLALYKQKLYVAETGQVLGFDYDADKLNVSNKQVLLDLPSEGIHWTRTLGIGPDENLYITIGSSCNICLEDDWRRTKMLKYNFDSQELSVYASGLRNAVFFAWHPVSQELFATEMGRDWLGDDLPPDELNIIKAGSDFGFPHCYGKNRVDPEYNDPSKCIDTVGSAYDFIAHEAPLGIDFYGNDVIIALHGSWNKLEPVGYQVILLTEASGYQERKVLLDGFLQEDGASLGRPAGVLSHSDGTIYITDDKSDLLFQLIPQD